MGSRSGNAAVNLLILNENIRDHLFDILRANRYQPQVRSGLAELLDALQGSCNPVVFLDAEAVVTYGVSIYSKIRCAAHGDRIILLCDRAHRHLIRVAMEHGSYGSIVEPYAEWELLMIVKYILSDSPRVVRRSEKRKKQS
jgi:FixJ family two-component response regulator